MSSTSPLAGKLSQIFSPRVCIFVSTIILAIGVIFTSLAGSFEAFVLGRVVTGVGAAGIFTVSIIIVLELTGSKRRGVFIGLLNSGYTVGVAAGATVAGALLPHVGWRALFWLQAPLALFGGTCLLFSIPHDFTAGKNSTSQGSIWPRLARIDYLGAVTLTLSIVLFLFALSSPKKIPVIPVVLSGIVLITFILNEVYIARDPIIPVTLLKSRGLLFTCLGTVGYMMSRWSVLFYTPVYALAVRDWSPATAGSVLIPTNGGFAIGGLLVGWLHIRRQGSFYIPSLVVYTLFPLTLMLLAQISTPHSSATLFIFTVFFNGFVTGAALNYTLAHLLHLTPKSTHYIATSLIATFRGFAGSFGSAIGGGIFTRVLRASMEDGYRDSGIDPEGKESLIRRVLGSPALVSGLNGVDGKVAVGGYVAALRSLWVAAAGCAALMILVQASTGWTAAKEEADVEVVSGQDHVHGQVQDEER
ncbi:hypothetical protein LTR50_007089 [Elasticomyces elasticus]|nr:hypothetical protein LTR50_007089 [Elasticomyces elasticus]